MVKIKRQISSGGVIFKRRGNSHEVALTARRGGKVWCLPKGLVEADETLEESAVRETREETGLMGRPVGKIGEISYWYYSRDDEARIFKTVHFYLLEFVSGSEANHDFEVEEVRWLPLEEAITVLTYKNEREIVMKAGEMLNQLGRGERVK
ncbi:MAG: NUDIX hydrolase [Candidatus Bathyarchaeia archaeon]